MKPYTTIFFVAAFAFFITSCDSPTMSASPGRAGRPPSEVIGNAASLAGQTVTVKGKVVAIRTICTTMGCPRDYPCCNECGGLMALVDEDAEDSSSGYSDKILLGSPENSAVTYSCSGDECSLTCSPLDEGSVYVVTGTLEETGDEYFWNEDVPYTLIVEQYSAP